MDFFGAQDIILWYQYVIEGTVVFDKKRVCEILISNNFKQNTDETDSKNQKSIAKYIPAYGF